MENVTLVENENIIADDKEKAKVLTYLFINIIKNSNIPKANHSFSNFDNNRDPTLKVVVKNRNRPRISSILGFYF